MSRHLETINYAVQSLAIKFVMNCDTVDTT